MSLPHACPRPRRRAWSGLSLVLALALTVSGCSASGDAAEGDGRDRSDSATATSSRVEVDTTVARVHGSLAAAERRRLEQEAGRLLGRYLSAAYLGRRATAGHRGSFPGFTSDARRLALQDAGTTSDAALTWADRVRPLGAVAYLSVVSPEGRPVGATARLLLRMAAASGDRREREVAVRGRLLLTPAGDRWRIFGYDVSVDSTATRRSAR